MTREEEIVRLDAKHRVPQHKIVSVKWIALSSMYEVLFDNNIHCDKDDCPVCPR